VYVVAGDPLHEFHWLLQHAAVLSALPAWTLRIVFPPDLRGFVSVMNSMCATIS
jgi:hypothetical protein